LLEAVAAEQQVELRARMPRRQPAQRVHGEARAAALDLLARDAEPADAADRPPRHLQAVGGRAQAAAGLVRRRPGRHEQHAIEAEALARGFGEREMAEV